MRDLGIRLRFWIAVQPWSILPAPLWVLIASPLLWWSFGSRGPIFKWPRGCSRSPLHASFWCVNNGIDH